MVHTTESGYEAKERLGGIDIYDEHGDYVCGLEGLTLDNFRDENDEIDDDQLDDEIKTTLEVQDFLDYQGAYC